MTTLQIGAIEATVVSDGRLSMDPSMMFGPDQPEEWRQQVHLDNGRVPFSVNCVLVRVGDRLILLDTGTGRDEPSMVERFGDKSGHLLESLHAVGVEPAMIDTVVLSHAHPDHVGGATRREGEQIALTFPNARYWLWKEEWDYWSSPESISRRPFLERKLLPLASYGRLELADSEVEVAPGVRLIAAPGHTPGHICIALTSGNEMAIYVGDLIHHPAQCEHPEWCPAFDLLPEMSAASRRRILEQAHRDGAQMITAHLPAPGIARPSQSDGWQTST